MTVLLYSICFQVICLPLLVSKKPYSVFVMLMSLINSRFPFLARVPLWWGQAKKRARRLFIPTSSAEIFRRKFLSAQNTAAECSR